MEVALLRASATGPCSGHPAATRGDALFRGVAEITHARYAPTLGWAEMLLHVASTQLEVQEKAAATASVIKWSSWLTEGPSNSLKKLHRFSRTATGWTESGESNGENDEVEERDDLDGLSREELIALKTSQSDTGEPVNAQAEANDQAEACAEQWGSRI